MWLIVETGGDEGRAVQATGERWIIGRDPASNLVVHDERVSRRHAMLRVYADGRAELHDLGSANGTLINGHPLTQPVLLAGNETIQVGETLIRTSMTPPSTKVTRMGAVPQDPRAPTPSTVERATLTRSVRTATLVGGIAIASVVGLVVLFATGVLGGSGEPQGQRPISAIVDSVRASTVQVLARAGGKGATGTGWVLDARDGTIVTNQHVVNEGETFEVLVNGGSRPATLLGSAPCDDLAVLRVQDTAGMVSLPLGSQSRVKEGDTVVAVGFPGSDSSTAHLTATTGVVSVVSTSFDNANAMDVPNYPNVIQTDVAINPGNSGGPLVDTASHLVGVNSAGTTLRDERIIQGQNYAIGVDRVKEVVPGLRAGRSPFWTGMGFDYVPDVKMLEGAPQPGLFVDNVVPGSPAVTAGLPVPAFIIAVNGQTMDGTLRSYCRAATGGPADAATITYITPSRSQPTDLRIPYATAPPR